MKFFLALIHLLFISSFVFAQPRQPSSTNKKALASFNKAIESLTEQNNQEAIRNLQKAIEADPEFIDAYIVLGQTYESIDEIDKSISAFEKAIEINPDFYPENFYYLANLRLLKNQYEEANREIKSYLGYEKRKKGNEASAKKILADTEFAKEAVKHPVDFKPLNLGNTINSEFGEYYPALTGDDKSIYFTRKLKDKYAIGGYQEDFYYSLKVNEKWASSVAVGSPINTPDHNEGAPTISADGRTMVFTACDLVGDKQYGERRTGYGSCDLFVSFKVGEKWSDPRNLGASVNTSAWESQPSISADGRTLYFIRGYRDRSVKITGMDIWTTTFSGGKWQPAKKLEGPVNTEGNESSVLIHPDGQSLYFASDGHPGFGGEDIFVSYKSTDTWGNPRNIGYPINTSSDENSLVVSANGELAYFASDRSGGYGDLDLYSFELPEAVRPLKVSYTKGKVADAKTRKPLEASFQLIDLATKQVIVDAVSDKISGEFFVTLPSNRDYALNVSREGYLFYSENFSLKDNKMDEPKILDIFLNPINVGEVVVLKNIFFDTDKFDLKKESEAELDKLYDFLVNNPALKIELSGHTDDQGDDKYNQVLSENRAKAVFQYLVDKGIVAARLSYKGYGETKPVSENASTEGRAKNRRTEFKVL